MAFSVAQAAVIPDRCRSDRRISISITIKDEGCDPISAQPGSEQGDAEIGAFLDPDTLYACASYSKYGETLSPPGISWTTSMGPRCLLQTHHTHHSIQRNLGGNVFFVISIGLQ